MAKSVSVNISRAVPTYMVHIRSLYPRLDVSYPPPGVYTGKIIMILPNPEGSSILGRLGDYGSSQVTVALRTEYQLDATTLHDWIVANRAALREIQNGIASPIDNAVLDRLGSNNEKRVHRGELHAAPLDFPLESLQDEKIQGSSDDSEK